MSQSQPKHVYAVVFDKGQNNVVTINIWPTKKVAVRTAVATVLEWYGEIEHKELYDSGALLQAALEQRFDDALYEAQKMFRTKIETTEGPTQIEVRRLPVKKIAKHSELYLSDMAHQMIENGW